MKQWFSDLAVILIVLSFLSVGISCSASGSSSSSPSTEIAPSFPSSSSNTYTISGKILLDGEEFSRVTITAVDAQNEPVAQAVSLSNGTYKIFNLLGGSYTLTPSLSGFSFSPDSKEVILSETNLKNIDFTALRDGDTLWSISGKIVTKEGGLGSAAITAVSSDTGVSYSTTSDSDGTYHIESLMDGGYLVTIKKEGYSFTPGWKELEIDGDHLEEEDFLAVAESIPSEDSIKIILTGDINLGNVMHEVINDPAIGRGDYLYPFRKLVTDAKTGFTPFIDISKADLTVGNLESMITDQGRDTKDRLSSLGYGVSLVANPQAIKGLVYAGFDILNLANNHSGDYGFEGFMDCMARLESNGIEVIGAGASYSKAHSPVIKKIKNTKIAFLGYTSVPMYADVTGFSPSSKWIARGPENDTIERPGIAWAHDSRFNEYGDFEDMADDIAKAKTKADIVIVSLHFGWEYDLLPDEGPADNQAQKRCAETAIDAGASIVFGHHPHVVQWLDGEINQNAIEKYKGGYIAYSLGNFVFDISSENPDAPNGEATRGLILEVIVKNKEISEIKQINTVYYDIFFQTSIVGYTSGK